MTKTDEQVARAYDLLDFLEAHPEQHRQMLWVSEPDHAVDLPSALANCRTTACAAGWTVLLAGLTIRRYDMCELGYVPYVAGHLLGLSADEKSDLFFGSEDLADVRKCIADIFGPRPGSS